MAVYKYKQALWFLCDLGKHLTSLLNELTNSYVKDSANLISIGSDNFISGRK